MKVVRTILAILGCCIIALGAYSAITFVKDRNFTKQEAQTVSTPESTETTEPVQEETPDTTEQTQPTEDSEATARAARAQEILDTMSLEDKIYQTMYVTPEAVTGVAGVTQAGEATKAALKTYPVGGLIYASSNLTSADQAKTLLENTQNFVKENEDIAPFLGVYDAGGDTSPVAGTLDGQTLDSFAVCGAGGNAGQATQLGVDLAKSLTSYHFNTNFASGADVASEDPEQDNSFGNSGQGVSSMVASFVEGLESQNVVSVLSHFPGDGAAVKGVSSKSKEELLSNELLPFTAGIEAGASMVLVSNITAQQLDTLPCCLSKIVMSDLLRTELGFTGIIMTDNLSGSNISSNYDSDEAAVMALEAGADMIYGVKSPESTYRAILAAINTGSLTEERLNESILRILTAKLKAGIIE